MLFIIVAFLFAALAAAGIGGILLAGGLSIFAMSSYTNAVKKVSDMLDAGKLTEDEAAGTVKLLSLLAILTSAVSIAKSTKNIEPADQVAYAALFAFYNFLTRVFIDPESPF